MEEKISKVDNEIMVENQGEILNDFDAENQEETGDGVVIKLSAFEGPLDLLLHLIKEAKIDIHDIFVSEITEQYLALMESANDLDVEKASEFIDMAATLLEIKSKKLLPKIVTDEETEEEDPEQKLIRQIEEYKLFKEATEKLKDIEDVNKFYRKPDDSVGDFRYVLPESLDLNAMIDAFTKVMQKMKVKAEVPLERKIEKDRFTVAQKIAQIKDTLIEKKQFLFSDLFESDYSRSEIINTFLAVLELLKGQLIVVKQNGTFDNIEIYKKEGNTNAN